MKRRLKRPLLTASPILPSGPSWSGDNRQSRFPSGSGSVNHHTPCRQYVRGRPVRNGATLTRARISIYLPDILFSFRSHGLSPLFENGHPWVKPEFLIKFPRLFIPIPDRDTFSDGTALIQPCQCPQHQVPADTLTPILLLQKN